MTTLADDACWRTAFRPSLARGWPASPAGAAGFDSRRENLPMRDADLQKHLESIRCNAPDCDTDRDARLGEHKTDLVVRCRGCDRILLRPSR